MKISFARNLDFWLGVPICFILTFFNKLKNIFIPLDFKRNKPEKIMFLELSEIGSTILAYSAMQEAKKSYADAVFYFWIFKRNRESIDILNIIPKENIVIIRDDNLFFLFIDVIRSLFRIWKEHIDVVIDMELFSRFSSILSFLSGARRSVGFWKFTLEGLYRGDLHTHKVSYNPYLHISSNFLNLVRSLEFSPKELPLLKVSSAGYLTCVPQIKSNQEARDNIWIKLKKANPEISKNNKIIILNPGVNEALPLRKWPITSCIELARKLLLDPSIFIVTIGFKSDSCEEEIMHRELSSPRLISLIGQTSIGDLISLYDISQLFISHDSGATNLASLTKISMVVLFGPETPVLYAPLSANKKILYSGLACSPCLSAYNHRRSICKNNRCLKSITVDEVYAACKSYI